MARYRAQDFAVVDRVDVETVEGRVRTIVTEIGDAVSTRDGRLYRDGARRVSVTGPSPKPRTKTFIGEMAWADARRHIDALDYQLTR